MTKVFTEIIKLSDSSVKGFEIAENSAKTEVVGYFTISMKSLSTNEMSKTSIKKIDGVSTAKKLAKKRLRPKSLNLIFLAFDNQSNRSNLYQNAYN